MDNNYSLKNFNLFNDYNLGKINYLFQRLPLKFNYLITKDLNQNLDNYHLIILFKGSLDLTNQLKYFSFLPTIYYWNDNQYFIVMNITCALLVQSLEKKNINKIIQISLNLMGNIIYHQKVKLINNLIYQNKFPLISIKNHSSLLTFPITINKTYLHYGALRIILQLAKIFNNDIINYHEYGVYYGYSLSKVIENFKINKIYLYDQFKNIYEKNYYYKLLNIEYINIPRLEYINNLLKNHHAIINKILFKNFNNIQMDLNYPLSVIFINLDTTTLNIDNIFNVKFQNKTIILFQDISFPIDFKNKFIQIGLKNKFYLIYQNEGAILMSNFKFKFKDILDDFTKKYYDTLKLILSNKENKAYQYLLKNLDLIDKTHPAIPNNSTILHIIAKLYNRLNITITNEILQLILNSKAKNEINLLPHQYLIGEYHDTIIDIYYEKLLSFNY